MAALENIAGYVSAVTRLGVMRETSQKKGQEPRWERSEHPCRNLCPRESDKA